MSEGPEVRWAADKIAEAILGRSVVDLQCKFIKSILKEKIIGSTVLSVDTYGKNIIIHFWNFRHWVFRRAGRPCWVCETPIIMDRHSSSRVTFWCPCCQQ
jgi:formamidopyrimidine-DNA glycosylase